MKKLEKYLSEIKRQLPDIEERLNAGASREQLEKLRSAAGCEIPQALAELYGRFNGEDMSKSPCFFAGLQFLPIETLLSQLAFFRSAEDELTAMGTRAVQERPLCELNWIPFAHDCSRAWLALDLSPAQGGTTGQIITVDYDGNYCYLLAHSMDDLLEKMTAWFQRGILTVDAEDPREPFIMERSGHLFQSLEELAVTIQTQNPFDVPLPEGFWQEKYGQSSVSINLLEKEKIMRLSNAQMDCTPFAHMTNMKELVLHDCRLKNLRALAGMPQLKTLIFAGCTFEEEDLSVLSKAPVLKELRLNVMSGAGLAGLSRLKSLKSLQVRALTHIHVEELAPFTALQELEIEKMGLRDAAFIGRMKNLKKLHLHHSRLASLDFLKNLKKLTEFHLAEPAENEDGLSALCELTKLKEFIYPVTDLSVYQGHTMLEHVGMAASVEEGFEAFAGSRVRSFTLLGKAPQDHPEEVRRQMEKYVRIYSWGTQC